MAHGSLMCTTIAYATLLHECNEKYICTTTATTTILWPFGWDYPVEPVPKETFTHSHLSWSSIILHLLPLSSVIHSILPPCSIYVPERLFAQPLSKSSLAYLLDPPLHTPYISSSNHCLLFTTHANTNASCFAVVQRLCHLIIVSLSTLYL